MGDRHQHLFSSEMVLLPGLHLYLFHLLLGIALFANPLPLPSASQGTSILVLKSGTAGFYDAVVDNLKKSIHERCTGTKNCGATTVQSYISNEAKPVYQEYDLVITLGLKAREYAQRHLPNATMINAMIPQQTALAANPQKTLPNSQTILLDQPIDRSLYLIKRLIPTARKVGLLVTPSEKLGNVNRLSKIAAKIDLLIRTETVDDESEIGRRLSQLLDRVDVLLAQPEIAIYNRKTVSKILLSAYRKRIPVIGYSAAYVKAGALAAVHATPKDIGRDIAETVDYFLAHRKIPADAIFPRYFSVSLNPKIGISLGIPLEVGSEELVAYIQGKVK